MVLVEIRWWVPRLPSVPSNQPDAITPVISKMMNCTTPKKGLATAWMLAAKENSYPSPADMWSKIEIQYALIA